MKVVRESDGTSDGIKPIDDPSWRQDKEGKKYSIYTDRNGEAYDPYYIVGAIFWNYYITYISLFLHLCVMTYLLNYWCRFSKLIMGWSF